MPDHLRMTFRVEDEQRPRARQGKDLDALQRAAAPRRCSDGCRARPRRRRANRPARVGLRRRCRATFESTPRRPRRSRAIPALVDRGDSRRRRAGARTAAEAGAAMCAGVRRLLLLDTPVAAASGCCARLDNAAEAGARPQPARQRRRRCSTTASRAALDALIADARRPGLGRGRLRRAARRRSAADLADTRDRRRATRCARVLALAYDGASSGSTRTDAGRCCAGAAPTSAPSWTPWCTRVRHRDRAAAAARPAPLPARDRAPAATLPADPHRDRELDGAGPAASSTSTTAAGAAARRRAVRRDAATRSAG